MANFSKIINRTFSFEGGFQNYPTDQANYSCGQLVGTNMGISAVALQDYLGRCVNVNDVRSVTKATAEAIYKKKFWDDIQGDKIANNSIAELIFSQKIANPTKCLQLVGASLKNFGKNGNLSYPFSDETIKQINQLAPKQFYKDLWQRNMDWYESLSASHPEFAQGWINRLNKLSYSSFPVWGFLLIFLALGGGLYVLNYYHKINLLKLIK